MDRMETCMNAGGGGGAKAGVSNGAVCTRKL